MSIEQRNYFFLCIENTPSQIFLKLIHCFKAFFKSLIPLFKLNYFTVENKQKKSLPFTSVFSFYIKEIM